jgi:hypothetical protein
VNIRITRLIRVPIFLFLPLSLKAQSTTIPIASGNERILERLEILTGTPLPFHSAIKPFPAKDAVSYVSNILDTGAIYNPKTYNKELTTQIRRILRDYNEWVEPAIAKRNGKETTLQPAAYELSDRPLLQYFYRSPANFFEANGKYYFFRINPVLNFQYARGMEGKDQLFENQRGIELRGGVDGKLFYWSCIMESQAEFPSFVDDYVQKFYALPGNALYKGFDSQLFDSKNAYDYLNAEGYIAFQATPHIGFVFGHGRNAIGNGYRSILLSGFSQNYLHLKVNWEIGPVRYQNLFAELNASSSNAPGNGDYVPKKYLAMHYLSIRPISNLTFGIFEATVFNRENQTGTFEWHYLNPVILYRSVEHFLKSPDNVLLGSNLQWNILRRFQLYGQLLLDEFKFKEFFQEDRWWGKKTAIQAGLKYINAFSVSQLDLQAEFNTIRPYTYSHYDFQGSSFAHYNQALAHPLGANFREAIFLLRYQPADKWFVESRLIRMKTGDDPLGQNFGSNILLPNTTFVQEFGNKTAQGIPATTTLLSLDISYEVRHNLFFDIHYNLRKKSSDLPSLSKNERYLGFGIRLNAERIRMEF